MVVLQKGAKIVDFFGSLLDAPNVNTIQQAMRSLKTIGALDGRENVTTLGTHLLDFPILPSLGKALILAVVLKCLDPILTIVAVLAYR